MPESCQAKYHGIGHMLTQRQQQIKRYVRQFHGRGLKPTITQIAEAFLITAQEVRRELEAIRNENVKPRVDVPDFLQDIFRGRL